MATVRLAERAPLPAPSQTIHEYIDYSLTEVSFVLHDLSWTSTDDAQDGCVSKLENEVMVDPWSSMDSSNSPLSESIPSASDECPPPAPPAAPAAAPRTAADAARARGLTLPLQAVAPAPSRRPHFLDDDDTHRSSNIDCRIPKPHFLDHSPSPDEFDERSDITNPNFLDDDADEDQTHKKSGALPKKPERTPTYLPEDRPHPTSYRSTLHFGLSNAARSSERDKRASQLYRGTWPGERDVWTGHDAASVKSYSSNGSAESTRPSSNLDNKMECVCSLISLLSLSPENNADLSGPLLEMSRSVESCIAMRQAGCIPLLVQLIHSKVSRDIRDRAAKALRNIIYTQTDDKAGRREARVWRLLEQVREYCYILEDIAHNKKEEKETIEDDGAKHPSQSVAALMKLSFDEEHRHVVCQLGGLQALAALVSGDQAAHGSRADDSTCLTMRKYAGMTLTNLTFGDGNNKSLLCSFKDFMLALVEQLESPNDDMRQVTAAVLRNLSWRADSSSKQVLREVGAVKGLTKAAMTCQKEATLKSVLSALWNLTAHCSMNKVALCSVDGALGFLVDMLSYDSPTKTLAIVENAGGIMRNVSSHIAVREDYRQILRERNCLSVLLQHLKSPSLTVVSNSCGTLWNLSARCPADQQFLWDHGAVPMLRSLIHSKHKMIAMGSGAALKNLLNSKPGKTHIVSLDSTARNMNLPALPTLGARKQKTLEQELDQNLAETCDNIEPATSPTTSNREEKNLFTATERQIAMNLERHRMTSSSPLMGALASQISLSHSAHLASYLSCSNTLLKGALVTRSTQGSSNNVNRSDSKDSVTSAQSDTVFEKVMRTGKVPVPTPRNKDLLKCDVSSDGLNTVSKTGPRDGLQKFPVTPPVPPPRTTEMRTNFAESGYDVDQDSCDQPIDFSRKYSETKTEVDPGLTLEKPKSQVRKYKKDSPPTFGDYQETDLDQPTDYSLRYAEHPSEHSDAEPLGPSVHEDSIKHFATEGTPYETPLIFSTATSMSDLRILGKDEKPKSTQSVKENPEAMTHSDEKDTCSIEDPPHDNDMVLTTPQNPEPEKPSLFDTKFSSGMISPEKPVNYCDEGTPGYFSRVSSLSSLGEPTEEDCLAKKNAMATIAVEPSALDNAATSKDKDGSKAVTFAACDDGRAGSPGGSGVQDTPLMFSRTSSLGSLPSAADRDHDPGSHSELRSAHTVAGRGRCRSPRGSGVQDTPLMFSRTSSLGSLPSAADRDHDPGSHSELRSAHTVAGRGRCRSPRGSGVQDTPLMFSRTSSLGSLPSAADRDHDPGSHSELRSAHTVAGRGRCRSPRGSGVQDTPLMFSRTSSLGSLPSAADRDHDPGSHSELRSAHTVAGRGRCRSPRGSGVQDTPLMFSRTSSLGSLPSAADRDHDPGSHSELRSAHTVAGRGRCRSPRGSGVQDTPLMFSRTSSLGSLPSAADRDHDPGSHSELSRLTSGCISPSEIPDSPGAPVSPPPEPGEEAPRFMALSPPAGEPQPSQLGLASPSARADPPQGTQTPGDSCRVYLTEDTPAGLSKAGSRSDLSALSLDSEQLQVAKHEDPSPDISLLNCDREDVYRSLPPYLRTSTETVKMSQELNRNLRDSASPPPLPPKDARVAAPPRPPRASRRHESRQSSKAQRNRQDSVHNESSSSLSLDSFGSTDREIFEETVQAGLRGAGVGAGGAGRAPRPRSLDRSWRRARRLDRSSSLSSLSNDSFGSTDAEVFERCVRAGMPRAERSPARRAAPRRERRAARSQGALDRMRGRHDRDRALLEQLIASAAQHKAKNAAAPPAPRAPAGGAAPAPPPAPELPDLLVACPPHPAPLARRAIALEAARLAARLAALPPAPPSLLEHVAPPADLDHSLLSVCSLSSDAAPLPAFDLARSAADFPLCHSFELLDLDKVEPPSLLAELTESADLPEPGAAPAPAPPIHPTDVEIATNDRREHKPLTPKEKRSLAKDRYQTYTIIDPPAAPDGDGSPVRTKTTAKQRRLEDRARYQTQTVDINTIIQQTKAADPEIEDLKRRLAAKKTIKQKRQEDVERYRTRTLGDDVPSPPRDDCGGRRTPDAHTPDVLDICTRNNIKNILMTESYQRALQTEKQTNPSTSHVASSGGDSNSEKGPSDSDEEALPRPKPKITIPERSDERPSSSDGQEKEVAKTVRGRKKAAYVSPYRRSVPPAKKPIGATGAIPKPPARDVSSAKGQTSAKTTTKTPPRPLSATTSPKKTLTKSPIKTKLQAPQKTAASPVIPVKPLPLERQGTFTKEESSVPTKDLPVPEKKATPNKYAKNVNGKSIPVASTSPSRLATWSRGGKPAAKAGAPTARGAPAPAPAAATASAPRGLPSATPAARSRQGSTSSLNSVNSSKTPTKDVESKIASLWKRVEQSKKGPTKPDKRIWIEGDRTEPSKLIRSSTFEGQPKQNQVSSAPKQKTTIGIKVSQIPSLRPKSTPSKINTTPVKKLAPPRVFARKPANGLAA